MIKKVVLYLLVIIVSLFVYRLLLYSGIRKNKAGLFDKYNSIFLKENTFNVLFLGSSRAETHFDTFIFDSITHKNSFNLGVTGATPRIAFGVFRAYCEKSQFPKFVVFDVDFHFLKYGIDTIRHFPRYFPYLENKELLHQFSTIDKRFTQFKMNPFYSLPFSNHRLLAASLHGWLNIPGKYDATYYKGFTKVVFTDTLKSKFNKPFYGFIHPIERSYLDSIINYCYVNKIKLILTTSPMFHSVNQTMLNKSEVIQQIQNIARINNLEYFDFSFTDFSHQKKYFTDYYHMTYNGAQLFTTDFAKFFKQYLNKKAVK